MKLNNINTKIASCALVIEQAKLGKDEAEENKSFNMIAYYDEVIKSYTNKIVIFEQLALKYN